MLKEFKADLHIHTCLSPCAELDMSPLAVVRAAAEKGIDIIAEERNVPVQGKLFDF